MNKPPPAPGATAQPLAAHRPGTPRPSSQQDGARGYLDLRPRDRETSRSRGLGSTPGTPHAHGPRDEVGVPSSSLAALQDATWPGPGSCTGRAQGNEQGEGPGLCQHHPPTGKRPQAATALWGLPRAAEAGEGPCRAACGSGDRGIPVFLPFCPSHATGLLVSHLGRTPPATSSGSPRGRPGAPARSAAGIKPAALPPLSSPRPPRATPRGGAACTPLGQTAKEPKT